MKPLLAACVLFAVLPLHAQELPDKPQPTVRVKMVDESTNKNVWLALEVPQPTIDRAWLLWNGAAQASAVIDVENSVYSLKRPGVTEVNPILGTNPGRAKYYALNEAVFGAMAYLSYRVKRENDASVAFGAPPRWHSKWWIIPAGEIAVHVFSTIYSVAKTGR